MLQLCNVNKKWQATEELIMLSKKYGREKHTYCGSDLGEEARNE